ncbi:MAG: glycosyltransferase family 39 protein, partial [bacterium]|nr:glycosyltransferase family 39 protein [bacterium]
MDFARQHKTAIAIFIIALLVRVLLLAVNLEAHYGDLVGTIHGDDGYYELSRSIMEGKGLGENPLRTPLYPGFIAFLLFISGSYAAVIGVQIILGALIPVLGRQVALRITGIPVVGLAVGLVLAFEPYFSLFSSIFYTETLFIFLFLVFITLFLSYLGRPQWRMLALCAFVLGVATLVKPTAQYLPVLLVPFLLWHLRHAFTVRKKLVHAALFAVIFLLVLSPWLYRNYRVFGVIGMTAQPAYNLYVYLVPSVLALERGGSFAEELKKNVPDEVASGHVITLANSREYSKKALLV